MSNVHDTLDNLLYYDTIPEDEKEDIRKNMKQFSIMNEIISFTIKNNPHNEHLNNMLDELDEAQL